MFLVSVSVVVFGEVERRKGDLRMSTTAPFLGFDNSGGLPVVVVVVVLP